MVVFTNILLAVYWHTLDVSGVRLTLRLQLVEADVRGRLDRALEMGIGKTPSESAEKTEWNDLMASLLFSSHVWKQMCPL